MSSIVRLKRSAVPGKVPDNPGLQLGELAINTYDGKIFLKESGSNGEVIRNVVIADSLTTGSINISGSLILSGSFDIGDKRVNHLVGGANLYFGGGDDGGAYTGDYSIYIGEEAGAAITTDTYPVNTALGYGVLSGSTNMNYVTVLGGGAMRNVSRDSLPYVGGSADSTAVAVGSSVFRNVSYFNSSVGIGDGVGHNLERVARSTVVGNQSFKRDTPSSIELYKVTSLGSYVGNSPVSTATFKHVTAIGHETLFAAGSTQDSILIGDYIGSGKTGISGSIFIGNYRVSGSNLVELGSQLEDVISIGHFVIPSQSHTVNFPLDYSLGLGTYTPEYKLDVSGSGRFTDELTATGSIESVQGFTGSLQGTASYALSASFLEGAVEPFPYTGSAEITGSLLLTGSLRVEKEDLLGPAFTVSHSNGYLEVGNEATGSYFEIIGNNDEPVWQITSENTIVYTGSVRGNVYNVTSSANTASIDLRLSNYFTVEVTGSVHLEVSNVQPGIASNVMIEHLGNFSDVTYDTNQIRFKSGYSYTASQDSGSIDILSFVAFKDSYVLANYSQDYYTP